MGKIDINPDKVASLGSELVKDIKVITDVATDYSKLYRKIDPRILQYGSVGQTAYNANDALEKLNELLSEFATFIINSADSYGKTENSIINKILEIKDIGKGKSGSAGNSVTGVQGGSSNNGGEGNWFTRVIESVKNEANDFLDKAENNIGKGIILTESVLADFLKNKLTSKGSYFSYAGTEENDILGIRGHIISNL